MKWMAAILIPVALLQAQTEESRPVTVSSVRHWELAGATRVAIEVSGDFETRSDRLHNPERVYFDIPNSRPRIDSRRLYTAVVESPRLKRIRVAETLPGVSRVVLELAEGVEVSTSRLTNPYRLIVELRTPPAAPAPPPETAASPRPAEQSSVQAVVPSPPKRQEPGEKKPGEVTERPPAAPVRTIGEAAGSPPEARSISEARPISAPEVAKGARRTSAGDNSLVRALGLKVSRVVIDPGHGGHDQGTEGTNGLLEKDLVLDVSMRLGKLITERMGAEVIYTRSDDTFVPLEGRTALANESKADLFLSVHANSSPRPRVGGIETFYLNITGSKDALDVAARENASSQKSVFELSNLIETIAKQDKAEESREFAGRIQAALWAASPKAAGAKDRGVKTAPFVVLIGAHMPSVLAEIGFLSNSREASQLSKPAYRQRLAEALYRGLSRYAESLSHYQIASSPASAPADRP